MITGYALAFEAGKGKRIGTPYAKMDCQGLIEQLLKDAGAGSHNWRGSNHMWREALTWRGTIDECITKFGCIPPGAWLFTIKRDGGEKARGYNDAEGNAAHVGLYLGPEFSHPVQHSTTGGVQWGKWPDSARWTHVGLCKYLEFGAEKNAEAGAILTDLPRFRTILSTIKEQIAELEEMTK